MQATALVALVITLGCSSFCALAQDVKARPIDAPDVKNTKPYSQDGISFKLPGNWIVTNNESIEGGGRNVSLEATKADFETYALEANLHVYPAETAATLQESAEYLVNVYQDEEPEKYTTPQYSEFSLGKDPALTVRYKHKGLDSSSAYAQQFGLYARKPCGEGWICLIYAQTIAANESAARAGLQKVFENVRYAP
jgi:hypothetical protein